MSSAESALHGSADLLRVSTAGSVDDGKSTLIGRLLFDTKTISCTLAGTRMPQRLASNGERDPANFQSSFQAAGVARDLVHPVADAGADLVVVAVWRWWHQQRSVARAHLHHTQDVHGFPHGDRPRWG